ncbi:MAG: DUF3592 domain-containing protein [Planctomycetes bacterium]|nr:DUF3592 domain-containing protein [Planctomycetota bacterium]
MRWRSGNRQPTKFGGVIAIIVGVAFAIGGIVYAASASGDQHDYEFLRDSGQKLPGEVIATRHEQKKSRRSTTHYYYLTVRYQHAAGIVVKEIEVEDGAYSRFKSASNASPAQCTVLSDPARADHFTLQEAVAEQIDEKGNSTLLALAFGLGIGLIATLSGIFTYKKAVALEHANRFAFSTGPYPPPGYQQPMPYPQQGQAPPYMPPQQRLQQNPYNRNQGPYRPS